MNKNKTRTIAIVLISFTLLMATYFVVKRFAVFQVLLEDCESLTFGGYWDVTGGNVMLSDDCVQGLHSFALVTDDGAWHSYFDYVTFDFWDLRETPALRLHMKTSNITYQAAFGFVTAPWNNFPFGTVTFQAENQWEEFTFNLTSVAGSPDLSQVHALTWNYGKQSYSPSETLFVDNIRAVGGEGVPTALTVQVNPATATIELGQSQTFVASASGGSSPYTYQWYLVGDIAFGEIEGETEQTLFCAPTLVGTYNLFVGVTDANGDLAQSNTVTLFVNEQEPSTYSLIVNSETGGTTTPSGTTTYTAGFTVTLTATPAEGYTFSKWVIDEAEVSENPITVTMDTNHVATAYFKVEGEAEGGEPPTSLDITLIVGAVAVSVTICSIVIVAKRRRR